MRQEHGKPKTSNPAESTGAVGFLDPRTDNVPFSGVITRLSILILGMLIGTSMMTGIPNLRADSDDDDDGANVVITLSNTVFHHSSLAEGQWAATGAINESGFYWGSNFTDFNVFPFRFVMNDIFWTPNGLDILTIKREGIIDIPILAPPYAGTGEGKWKVEGGSGIY